MSDGVEFNTGPEPKRAEQFEKPLGELALGSPLYTGQAESIDPMCEADTQHDRETYTQDGQIPERQATADDFTEIYSRYLRDLEAFVRRHLNGSDAQHAEDITGQTFLKAFDALLDGRGPNYPQIWPWLSHNAVNEVISWWRVNKRQGNVRSLDGLYDHSSLGADSHLPFDELVVEHDELLAILPKLSPLQRQVLAMEYIDGLSRKEIAHILGKKEGAIRGILFRAKVSYRRIAAELAGTS